MHIAIIISVVFSILFLFIFKFIHHENKTERESERLSFFGVIFVACMIALIPSVVIVLILFALFGSTISVNLLFSLGISNNQLIIFGVCLFAYLFSIDSVIAIIIKYLIGKSYFYLLIIMLTRVFAFYMIGLLIGLDENTSFIISAGVASIIFIIEVLYRLSRKKEKTSQ